MLIGLHPSCGLGAMLVQITGRKRESLSSPEERLCVCPGRLELLLLIIEGREGAGTGATNERQQHALVFDTAGEFVAGLNA